MSQEFEDWIKFIMFVIFVAGFFSFLVAFLYLVDAYFVSLKKAIICACIGISCLIIDTIICYVVWG